MVSTSSFNFASIRHLAKKYEKFNIVIGITTLLLAIFFSWCLSMFNKLSEDEIKSSYPKLEKVILFSGTSGGKVILSFLWISVVVRILFTLNYL